MAGKEVIFDFDGKRFTIGFVSNYVQQLHAKLINLTQELQSVPADMQQVQDEVIVACAEYMDGPDGKEDVSFKSKVAQARIRIEGNKKETKLREKMQTITAEMIKVREEILKEILTSNKYEFEPDFWYKQIESIELESFLRISLEKDSIGQNKKKGTAP